MFVLILPLDVFETTGDIEIYYAEDKKEARAKFHTTRNIYVDMPVKSIVSISKNNPLD